MMNYCQQRQPHWRSHNIQWWWIYPVIVTLILSLSSLASSADIGKYFTRTPSSIVSPPGDRVTFQCETNIPSEQVRWKLNGRFLNPANESDIRISGNLLNVKLSKHRERYMQQTGDYQCVAEFGAESLTSLPAQLSIAHMDPFGLHENKTIVVVEGNTVVIECNAPYSNPSPIILYYKDGKEIDGETVNSIVMDSGVLHLFNVSMSDSGLYWCSVTNPDTTETFIANWATRLVVQSKSIAPRRRPEFLIKPKSYPIVVPKGSNVTIQCVAIGNPPPSISFRKLRSPSMTNFESSRGTLQLYDVDFAQEGEYVCDAFNTLDSITALTTLVLISMPNITKEPKSLVVEEGVDASFDCATEGLPKPRVYWVFNGHNVHDDGNIKINESGLKISRVEKKHAGLFQCFATNPMGTVTSPVELKVIPKQITANQMDSTDIVNSSPPLRHHNGSNGNHHKKFHRAKHNKRRKHKGQDMIPPSKPHLNRVSDESIMIRWSVPPNSGYPIQFFKIQFKEVSKRNSRWMTIDDDIPPHLFSYEVRDLRVGHAYRFRIAAVYSNNDNKVGPNSEKFVLQKDSSRRPSSSPTITSSSAYNATAITLTWKYAKAESGSLDGYFIYYREATSAGDYSKVTILGAENDQAYITHLSPGTNYDFKIQAFNRSGASAFSGIFPAKTKGNSTIDTTEEETITDVPPIPEPIPSNNHLYILLGCLFVGFWLFMCIACALCYKCKQKQDSFFGNLAEEDVKYHCDVPLEVETKTNIPNGHANGHAMNGYIHPTITNQLDEKETSFVERHNNNRPISPSSACDLASFKSNTLENNKSVRNGGIVATEMKILSSTLQRERETNSRNNSLQKKKRHSASHANFNGGNGSLRRGPYVSCSSEDLDGDDSKDTKIFPKEHYKVSRKHNRKRNSMIE